MAIGPCYLRRVVVHGAGAIGSLLGGKLAVSTLPEEVHPSDEPLKVALIARRAHAAAIRERGLKLSGLSDIVVPADDRLTVFENIADLVPRLGSRDIVLLAVKAQHAGAAARELSAAHGKSGPVPVYALQNGTGYEEELATNLSKRFALHHAVVHMGATFVKPGEVQDWGGEIFLPIEAMRDDTLLVFQRAGIKVRCLPIETERWKKIAFNCALNAFSAILDARNRETLRPELRTVRWTVLNEVREEAVHLGVKLPDTEALLRELEARAGASNNVNSMLQDLRAGKPTEIGFLNEAIARKAQARGMQAPANAALAGWVRMMEDAQGPAQEQARRQAAEGLAKLGRYLDGNA